MVTEEGTLGMSVSVRKSAEAAAFGIRARARPACIGTWKVIAVVPPLLS
jgi:hypothetical protein